MRGGTLREVANPIPYLLICAFIANAASFVLPISNPANLVIYGGRQMPPLGEWLATFLLPSVVAILATYAALYYTQRRELARCIIAADTSHPVLSHSAKLAGLGIAATAAILLIASWRNVDLGLPTFMAGALTATVILVLKQEAPYSLLKGISWGVIPLVAGLFLLIEALQRTGVIAVVAEILRQASLISVTYAAALAGSLIALVCNLLNNLPAGLLAAGAVHDAQAPKSVVSALLIGVDLGPNLSATGSLATILWLCALRREGLHMGTWDFLKIGMVVMPPALFISLLVLLKGSG